MSDREQEHRYKQYSEDEVACMDCGHEPWHSRPEPDCPGPTKTAPVKP